MLMDNSEMMVRHFSEDDEQRSLTKWRTQCQLALLTG